jgi:hypothetical protein
VFSANELDGIPGEVSACIERQKAAGFAVGRALGFRSAYYRRATGHRSWRAIADEQLVEVRSSGLGPRSNHFGRVLASHLYGRDAAGRADYEPIASICGIA